MIYNPRRHLATIMIVGILAGATHSTPSWAAAQGLDADAAAKCYSYAIMAKRMDVQDAAARIILAHGAPPQIGAHQRAFLDRVRAAAALNQRVAAQMLVDEGREGCRKIGAM